VKITSILCHVLWFAALQAKDAPATPLLDRIISHSGSYSQVCDIMTAEVDVPGTGRRWMERRLFPQKTRKAKPKHNPTETPTSFKPAPPPRDGARPPVTQALLPFLHPQP
jgi:hypothetical protein